MERQFHSPGRPEDLPDLVKETSAWEEWIASFLQWLGDLFPATSWKGSDFSMSAIYGSFKVVGITILILVALLIIYTIYRNIRGLKAVPGYESSTSENKPVVSLDSQWADAINAKEWARAMRLRWVVFLRRRTMAPSLTPMEYANDHDGFAGHANQFVQGMYCPGFGTQALYEKLHNLLTDDEKKAES